MKPISIHLDRLSGALADKGVELKRTDLLQIAAAAFGYHNQNEASAASRRGDLDVRQAVPVCRVSIPSTPYEREIVVLEAENQLLYGIDAAFFDSVKDRRAERYGPTPYGTLLDLSYATHDMDDAKTASAGRVATTGAHLDRALREARRLREQLGNITGETDEQGQDIGQAENTLSRLIAALEGGAVDDSSRRYETDGSQRVTNAERASWGKDIDGMKAAIETLAIRQSELAMVTPDTRRWAEDCFTALKAGIRIADDWKRTYEQEVRFGPDWKAWTHDLRKASTRGATPLSDADLHKIRHAVADNHCKSSESERSQTRWRVGTMMEKYARALLLRLDVAESRLEENDLAVHGNAYVPVGSLWRVIVMTDGGAHPTRLFRVGKNENAEVIGNQIATEIGGYAETGNVSRVIVRRAPREEASLRLLDATRTAVSCIPEDASVRKAMISAIRAAEKALPPVVGNQKPEAAPKAPPVHMGEDDHRPWRHNMKQAEALQDAILLCTESYALGRGAAAAMLTSSFGFDLRRSHDVLEGRDLGVRAPEDK